MEGARKQLSGRSCLREIRKHFEQLPDRRRAASTVIPLADALMSGFAVFSLKFPSLLQFEQRAKAEFEKNFDRNKRRSPALLQKKYNSNLRSLYGIREIPSDTQMRSILDEVDPDSIRGAFAKLFEPLQRGKALADFEFHAGHYLLSIDGTGYFSSDKVHCDSCMMSMKKKAPRNSGLRQGQEEGRGGRRGHSRQSPTSATKESDKTPLYYHQMLGAALVHPERKTVIPFCPEPILKQDGEEKNDCERNACRRFLAKFRQDHPRLKVIVVEDALGANTPHVKDLKDYGMHFILGVKPASHPLLFRGLEKRTEAGDVKTYEKREIFGKKIRKRRTHRFRYVNGVLLSGADVTLAVNFLEYWETTEWTDPKGRPQRTEVHFSWVTDLGIHEDNLMILMRGGRARWKIENETFNTLKNQGYEFEHNFGHGTQNLTTNFASLMMLAFLFDQIQEHCCALFQAAHARCVSRISLWSLMRSMYCYVSLANWSAFMSAIAKPNRWKLVPDTS
jgi:hypothetical protein